jgi:hypothetical protein
LQAAALVLAAPCCNLQSQQQQRQQVLELVHQHQRVVLWAALVVVFPTQQLVQ